jgi:hypothetical protein
MRSLAFIVLLLALCVTSYAEDSRQLRAFPTEKDVLPTREAKQLLRRARIDFALVQQRKSPRYAKLDIALYDGGTRIYKGRGYSLTDSHKIAGVRHGKVFYEEGAGISLTRPITSTDLWYSEAHVRR